MRAIRILTAIEQVTTETNVQHTFGHSDHENLSDGQSVYTHNGRCIRAGISIQGVALTLIKAPNVLKTGGSGRVSAA
jgi:hypothetical protein